MVKQYGKRSKKLPGHANTGTRSAASRLKRFHPVTSNNKPRYSFEEVRDHFIDHLQVSATTSKNINDIVKSIEERKLITITAPVLEFSKIKPGKDADLEAQRDNENRQFELDYSSEKKAHSSRAEDLRTNQPFVRGLILTKFVTQAMEDKLRNESDFNTTLQNPIEMINRIERFMKESDDGKYDVFDFFQQQQKLYTMKQGSEESVTAWKNRYKRQAEIVAAKAGNDWFKHFIQTTQGYKDLGPNQLAQQTMRDNAIEIVMATGLLCNSDRKRTEPLLADLREQYARGLDQYPKTLEDAHNMLTIYMSSHEPKEKTGASLYQKGGKGGGKKKPICYVCGKEGCIAPKCNKRWLPRDQWASKEHYKSIQAVQERI